jgi:hypothetical protein
MNVAETDLGFSVCGSKQLAALLAKVHSAGPLRPRPRNANLIATRKIVRPPGEGRSLFEN